VKIRKGRFLASGTRNFLPGEKPGLASADANREGSPRGLAGQEAAAGRKGRKKGGPGAGVEGIGWHGRKGGLISARR